MDEENCNLHRRLERFAGKAWVRTFMLSMRACVLWHVPIIQLSIYVGIRTCSRSPNSKHTVKVLILSEYWQCSQHFMSSISHTPHKGTKVRSTAPWW